MDEAQIQYYLKFITDLLVQTDYTVQSLEYVTLNRVGEVDQVVKNLLNIVRLIIKTLDVVGQLTSQWNQGITR